ncbi:methyltransferase domain-containing protein [Nocardioides sp. T2.26MG-1]|uniref:methyltransferase domain-containing protein n=1 Tax=Nocardioides sp. T2.26MG-1 TaxID=3041166 RepID=UPI0024773427|nr:methyltransferase domain-containing protein [Nocardioides sp. T2.26MG-1]CAI9418134.1 2-methoxy-6-polyprenyl-1,4-benzoquinol methylase, mitochondrial [Nocardioides sp. T2.26MG-1]
MTTLESERPADYLTRLAASELGQAYKALVVDEMQIDDGATVLDLGCGPGADLQAFADASGPQGRVIGIDSDSEAIEVARRRVAVDKQIEVAVGDVHRVPMPAHSVDRVHTDRVIQHVDHPEAVIAEAARVLRPRGIAAFAEPDWDTLVIDFPRPEVHSSYRRFIVDHVVRNARIGRRIANLCDEQGLSAIRVIPVTAIYRDAASADRVFGFARVTRRAVEAGYLSAADADEWLGHLSTQRFFASVSLFVTLAQKPGS